MAQSTPLFVGLDVHKDSIAVAHAAGGSTEPPVFVGAIGSRQADLDHLLRRLQGKASALPFAYEAGPWVRAASVLDRQGLGLSGRRAVPDPEEAG
jgi:hypothetical protein